MIGPSYVDATEGGKKIRRGAKLWTIAVATFKSETYRFLSLSPPVRTPHASPAGNIHLPRGVDAEWVKQLVAEQLVTVKTRRGFTRLEWQKLRERNEALDCRVYARAAAWIAGIDRWPERKWRELEKQLGIEVGAGDPPGRRRLRRSPDKQKTRRPKRMIGAPCGPAGSEAGRGTGCSDDNRRSVMTCCKPNWMR